MTHRAARLAAALLLASAAALPAFGAGQSPRNQSTRDGAIMALHPIAYWPLDDTGAVVADKTTHGNDGFYEGARGGAPGSNGGHTAALFSGIPGINLFGTNAAVQGNGARTVIAWIRTFSPDPQAIFASGFAGDGGAFNLVVGYGACPSLGVMGFNDDFYPCGRALDDGFWHMVAPPTTARGPSRSTWTARSRPRPRSRTRPSARTTTSAARTTSAPSASSRATSTTSRSSTGRSPRRTSPPSPAPDLGRPG